MGRKSGGNFLLRGDTERNIFTPGNYYPAPAAGFPGTGGFPNGTMQASPLAWPGGTLERLMTEITVAGDVGSILTLGVYADDGTGYPGTRLGTGTAGADTAAVKEIVLSLALAPGDYWVALLVTGTPILTPTMRTRVQASLPQVRRSDTAFVVSTAGSYAVTGAAAMTDPFPAGASTASNPGRLMVRRA